MTAERRMLIVDAELVSRIDQNRGDLGQAEFINFLIDSCLKQGQGKEESARPAYITRQEFLDQFNHFQQGTRELLRNFMEFFVSYGMELGKQPEDATFEELTHKLQTLSAAAVKTKNS